MAGCGGQETVKPPVPAPTPIARLDTATMQLPRIDFCSLVSGSAVAAALGGKATADSSYGNGQAVGVAGVGRDRVHETGCTWSRGAVRASAWVFAQPVTAGLARSVISAGAHDHGCREVAGPAFGRPSYTRVCGAGNRAVTVRHAGLFGQTWLTCEVGGASLPSTGVRARADAWCVAVATALDTAR